MSKIRIIYEKYVDLGEKIIFPAFNHNCLYSLDKKTKYVEFLGHIPCSKMINKRSFFSIAEYKGKIILVPFNENNIVIYDTKTKEFLSIELKSACLFKNVKNMTEDGKFACCSKYKNKLFIFPHFYPALVILNLETFEVQYDVEFVNRIEKNKFNDEPYIDDIDVSGKLAYGSIGCNNSIVIYNMDLEQAVINDIQYSGEGFNGIKIDDKNLVLAPRKQGPILFYDIENGSCEEYANYPEGYDYSYVPFQGICKINGGYLFVTAMANEIIFFDINKKEMFNISKISKVLVKSINNYFDYDRLLAYGIEENFFWFINASDHMLYKYDLEMKKLTAIELNCPECPIEQKQIMAEICWGESVQIGLNDFIDLIYKGI